MNQRKNRPHLCGQSNRHALINSQKLRQSVKSLSKLNNISKQPNLFQSKSSFFGNSLASSYLQTKSEKQKNDPPKLSGQQKQVIQKIKDVYKGKKNVRRIVKSWKIPQEGFISSENLRKTLEEKFKIPMSQQQTHNIIKRYSNFSQNKDKLDTQGFLKLLYHDQPTISLNRPIQRQQYLSDNKIKNLIDDMSTYISNKSNQQLSTMTQKQVNSLLKSYNSCAAKIKKIYPESASIKNLNLSQSLRFSGKFSEKEVNALEKLREEVGDDQILQKVYTNEDVSQQIFDASQRKSIKSKQKFFSSSQRFNQKLILSTSNQKLKIFQNTHLSSKTKSQLFSPISMINLNQMKTRFGATPIRKFQEYSSYQKVQNQKDKIDQILRNQRLMKKNRYQNKLDNIRNNQQRQKQSIRMISAKIQAIDASNMKKMALEQSTYNYATFIKNQWV